MDLFDGEYFVLASESGICCQCGLIIPGGAGYYQENNTMDGRIERKCICLDCRLLGKRMKGDLNYD